MYELADGRTVTMDIAFGLIEFMGDAVAGTIIFGEPDAEPILGVTALESAGIESRSRPPAAQEVARGPAQGGGGSRGRRIVVFVP